jgi:single-stranded-DNA-specific exonuclease
MKWEILSKNSKDIIGSLLKNRGIKNKEDFFNPKHPEKIKIKDLGIKKSAVSKAIKRIKLAKKNKEGVVVYGDYDADGICATAIMWEALFEMKLNVLPHIPDRFEEGYGLNSESVEKLKSKYPNLGLIVTVDNGIVAYAGIKKAKQLGIDVIVVDHHTNGKKKLEAYEIIHTTEVCGSALAYFFAKELGYKSGLDLAAIGTIADQMQLLGVNRSIVKHGLKELNSTKRPGILALFKDAGVENVGTYEVNYIIAPRINAMGRLSHGLDSLRLLCTRDEAKARELAKQLSRTNTERQRIVDEVVIHTTKNVTDQKVIVLAHESYHEGVIGLAAGKLVERFYRPAIVLSVKGDISKASARSILGFNIIENIKKLNHLILEGGGHPMAAGFSISTSKIEEFKKQINEIADKVLTDDLLQRKIKIDLRLDFDQITWKLYEVLKEFDPTGLGNPTPTFSTSDVEILDVRPVGQTAKHLKFKLKQNEQIFDAIYFGGGGIYSDLTPTTRLDVAYQIADNSWNGSTSLQLKIRDLKLV